MVAQSLIAVLFAMFIYKFIISKRGANQALLLGLGVVLPFTLMLPFEVIRALDIRNRVIMMSLTSQPTLLFLRTLEAIFGTSPAGVESSLRNYCIYLAIPLECTIDERTRRPTKVVEDDVNVKKKLH